MQNFTQTIIEIIKNNFPNGIRDDFIDINKVRRLYLERHANEENLRALIGYIICRDGIADGGRYYFIADDDFENIKRLIDDIFEKYSIAYYSSIYERHADFFNRMHIFSPTVLKKILQEADCDHIYFDEFCSEKQTGLDQEVDKAFKLMNKNLSVEELQKLLPYVPTENIKSELANVQKYLPTVDGKFIPRCKIQYDSDEIDKAKRQIASSIDAKGYADRDDYNLESNFALNYELDENALRDLIFQKFFAQDFSQRAKKIYKKGDPHVRRQAGFAEVKLRKFIAEHQELSTKKLFEFAKELDAANWFTLNTAFSEMVRVSKELFVKDELIDFDVDGIDDALAPFVQDKIIPIRAVKSFTGFPSVGAYTWNLFLLESFLRKYSRRYTYNAPASNSSNVGAIYPRSMTFRDYNDVQAAAVVQEKIPIETVAVMDFLIGKGYRAARNAKSIDKIIVRSKDILNL